ncbi:MAG: CPBP family intramembrane metalloprotease [Eubacteriales bacterium]|nr:CPBP family intramembrane metalloprotease [Eubacteriales bacterium]
MDEKEIKVKEEKTAVKNWKWYDNALCYVLAAILLTLAGQVLGAVLVMMPVGVVMGISGNVVLEQGKLALPPVLETVTMYLPTIGVWIVLLLCFLKKRNKPLFRCITPYCSGNTVKKFLLGILIGGGMNGLCILAAYLHGDIELTFDAFPILPLLLILVCVFIQSSSEELLCRGYLYQKLFRRYGAVVAIAGNSLFFALLHLGNPGINAPAFIDLVLSGLLFSMMVYYMDSIWCAFAAHTAWNYTQNIIFGLPNSGLRVPLSIFKLNESSVADSFFYNAAFGIEGTWFAVIVEAAVIAAVVLCGRKNHRKPTNIWAPEEETIQIAEGPGERP